MLYLQKTDDGIWLHVIPHSGPRASFQLIGPEVVTGIRARCLENAIAQQGINVPMAPISPDEISKVKVSVGANSDGMTMEMDGAQVKNSRMEIRDAALSSLNAEYKPSPMSYVRAQQQISDECDKLKQMLLEKNRKYGNSALEPKRCFSKASADEQIRVRLDDKLSRMANMQPDETEDVILDLLGYLLLLRIAQKNKA